MSRKMLFLITGGVYIVKLTPDMVERLEAEGAAKFAAGLTGQEVKDTKESHPGHEHEPEDDEHQRERAKLPQRTFLRRSDILEHFHGCSIVAEWTRPAYLNDIFQKEYFLK